MKSITGKVLSNKMKNTATVLVERWVVHPMYSKRIRRSKKVHADNTIQAGIGDTVKIESTKPISKTKHFKIIEVIAKHAAA